MKLREMTRVDYKDSHTNTKRTTEITTRTSTTATSHGRKPATVKPTVAAQRRTTTGRVAKAAAATPKRSPGRPPKRGPGRPSKRGSGRRSSPAVSTAVKSSSRVAPKGSSRRAANREHQPPSPIVKIVKRMPAPSGPAAQGDDDNAEHHTSLMFKFFKAHEDDVAHVPKKKQRKALGKMWRESSVNPKNARAKKEVESSDTASEDEVNVAKTKVEDVDSSSVSEFEIE